tara:strand:+ start:824 stop:2089 length:1266 start_codon:yes stop_codon:yes gene_type:complete
MIRLNKTQFYFSLIFIQLFVVGCLNTSKNDLNEIHISGQIINPLLDIIKFESTDSTFTAKLTKDGNFTFSFLSDSSLYLRLSHGEYTSMYVMPGDIIKLSINTEEFDESVYYDGSEASNFLAKKYLIQEEFNFYSKEYYLGSAEGYDLSLSEYKSSIFQNVNSISDTAFMNQQSIEIDNIIAYWRNKKEKFMISNEADIREFLFEKNLVNEKYDWWAIEDTMDINNFNKAISEYENSIKLLIINLVKDDESISKQLEILKDEIDSRIERKLSIINKPQNGESYIDFTYENNIGDSVSLSSFKGSLVYVDVWATWCGPCKAEIPYLKSLEQDYHEQNIVFLSVSVDTNKDEWLKMVKEEELGGIQLWADGWSQITKDYAIFGIPRFMLFSKDGKVISNDAPRPSNEETRKLFDKYLTDLQVF